MLGRRYKLRQLSLVRNPDCNVCALHKSTVNRCIMGRGNPMAKIHLIGEAPGENEAKTGLPFMGKAGQLLDRILNRLGLMGKVYISNSARCRPPKNRKPTQYEVQPCIKLYLYRELDIVQPHYLVLLGRTAIDNIWRRPFTRGTLLYPEVNSIKDQRLLMGRMIMCTWHPSYCLRFGRRAEQELEDHLAIVRNHFNGVPEAFVL